ncbi:MAG TPA: S41 family peptidase [Armatimonadota bacterium]|nr:S41 family peptidase [Armatimonadota bacterium]
MGSPPEKPSSEASEPKPASTQPASAPSALRRVKNVALTAGVLLFLVGAGYRTGAVLQGRSLAGHGATRAIVTGASRIRGNFQRMIALGPGAGDARLGMRDKAFPQTLDSYWVALNTIVQHFYNPTPITLFTDTGRAIFSNPQRMRTYLTYQGIRGIMSSLNDPYSRFLDPEAYKEMQQDNAGAFGGIGAQLEDENGKIIIAKPLPDTPAADAHLLPMDQIIAINGKSTHEMTSEMAVRLIRGKPGTPVTLTILRAGKQFPVRIVRAIINAQNFDSKIIDGDIGYMRLMLFDEQAADNVEKALEGFGKKNVKGLVLDLRDNPGGLLNTAVDLASKFIPPGPVVYVQERAGQRVAIPTNNDPRGRHRLPLAVLVNHYSASASEILAGAIKDTHSGTIIGTTTWGKGLVQEVIPLNDNSAIALTIERYYTPSGADINKKGITPDIVVGRQMAEPQSQADVAKWLNERNAMDKTQLDTAVALIHREIGDSKAVANSGVGSGAQATGRPRIPPASLHAPAGQKR